MTAFSGLDRRLSIRGSWISVGTIAATPAVAQSLIPGAVDDDISPWRIGLALLVCMAVAIGGAFILRLRTGASNRSLFGNRGSRPARLQLGQTLRLSHQIDLCIIACDDRELLIAASPKGANLICCLPPAEGSQPASAEGMS